MNKSQLNIKKASEGVFISELGNVVKLKQTLLDSLENTNSLVLNEDQLETYADLLTSKIKAYQAMEAASNLYVANKDTKVYEIINDFIEQSHNAYEVKLNSLNKAKELEDFESKDFLIKALERDVSKFQVMEQVLREFKSKFHDKDLSAPKKTK